MMRSLLPLLFLLALLPAVSAEPEDFDRRTFHRDPSPLPEGAVTSDWPRFLGPDHNAHSPETHLLKDLPASGPTVLWEVAKGASHTGPVISGDHLVFIHLLDGKEVIECLHPQTGKRWWKMEYPVSVGQSYGITDAPRAGPVTDGERVYTVGVDGHLHCLELATGKVLWKKNLEEEYGESPFFFGRGSCPLVLGDLLIVHVGASPSVAGFDKRTGELRWGVEQEWHGSYASPIPAQIHGQPRVFLMAGGMTDPPEGGLLSVDPVKGELNDTVPWRSTNFASVLAASPVALGSNSVFITEDYGKGSARIDFSPGYQASVRWEAPGFGSQFATPVAHEGVIYGFSGSSTGAELMALDADNGQVLWRDDFRSNVEFEGRTLQVAMGRGSLLHVDGAFLTLGEQGTLAWLDLSRKGARVMSQAQLFYAPETFGIPAISRGLLYVSENEGRNARLRCYDLRGAAD